MATRKKKKSGPKAETLKLKGKWESLVKASLTKKKPATGWPTPKK